MTGSSTRYDWELLRIVLIILMVISAPAAAGQVPSDAESEESSTVVSTSSTNIDDVTFIDKEDWDDDSYYSNFNLSVTADTRISESFGTGDGEPYFQVKVGGKVVKTTSIVNREVGSFKITIPREDLETFDASAYREVEVLLFDEDTGTDDDRRGSYTSYIFHEPVPDSRLAVESILEYDGVYDNFADERLDPQYHQDRQTALFFYTFEAVFPVDEQDVAEDVLADYADVSLVTDLFKLVEVGGATGQSLEHGKRADLLRTATSNDGGNFRQFNRYVDDLEENTRNIKNADSQAERKSHLQTRLSLIEKVYTSTQKYNGDAEAAVSTNENDYFVGIIEWLYQGDEATYETIDGEFQQLESALESDYVYTQVALQQDGVRELPAEVDYSLPEYPDPYLEVNTPETVQVGEPATIELVVQNQGGPAVVQTAAVSFPDIEDPSRVSITQTGIDNPDYADVFGPGSSLGQKYGATEPTTASYVLAEVGGETTGSSSFTTEVEVIPKESGELRVYAKSVASNGGWYAHPEKIADNRNRDQQSENVITKTITVNIPPSAEASGPYTVEQGSTVNLDSSGSTDEDGHIQETTWQVISGPGSVSDGTYHAPDGLSSDTTATVELTVTDDDGATATDQATISLEDNNPPSADAGGPYPVDEGGTTHLDGSGSSDSDGSISSTSWSLVSGPGSVSGGTYYAPDSLSGDATATVELTVTDDDGASATDQATVNLKDNNPPSASFTYSPSNPQVGDSVSFNENASDPDGFVQSYEWEFGDGSTSSIANPSHTYSSGGNYDVTLTVTDDNDNTASTTKTIVIGSNSPPSAEFNYSPVTPAVDELITFDASNSTDPDNDIQSYEWDFDGDGTADKKGEQVTHTYKNTGVYDVTLTVSDSSGDTKDATITKAVSVTTSGENTAPTADAGGPYTVTAGNIVTLNSSNSTDSDGTIVSTSWQIIEGPGSVSDGTYTAPSSADSETTAMVELTVTDNDNATDTDTASVNVESQNLPDGDGQIYRLPFVRNERMVSDGFKSNLQITAQQSGTSVEVDYGATGTIDKSRTLNRDETASFSQPIAGTIVTASAPVKVAYRYTSADFGAYEDGRYKYGVLEADELGTEYYAPMAADALNVAATADTEVRADTDGDGNIEQTITLNANETATFTEIAAGAHVVADEKVHAVVTNARWSNMDNTYAASLLPVSAAQPSYDLLGHPSYNVEDPTDKTRVALVATQNETKVDVGNQTVEIAKGEVKTVQTSANTTVEADAPVVALYAIHLNGQDWWGSDYREFIGVGTPVDEFKIHAGEWSGKHFDNGLAAWSTYNIDTSSREPTAAFTISSSSPYVNESVTFDSGKSSQSSGEITSYEWDLDGDGTTEATGVTVTHAFESAGEYDVSLTVSDDSGQTDTRTKTVQVMRSDQPTVSLEPLNGTVSVNGTTTFTLKMSNVDGGVGAFDPVNVTLEEPSTVSIQEISSPFSDASTTRAADGSQASVTLPFGGDTVDTGTVELAMVTVRGEALGNTTARVTVTGDVARESSTLYENVSSVDSQIQTRVGTPALPGMENPPTNVDGDSQLEDINGNGGFDIGDVQALFANRNSDAVQNNVNAFDFNGNDEIDIGDVQALFVEYLNS